MKKFCFMKYKHLFSNILCRFEIINCFDKKLDMENVK